MSAALVERVLRVCGEVRLLEIDHGHGYPASYACYRGETVGYGSSVASACTALLVTLMKERNRAK